MTARILYVEDDPDVRGFVESLLSGEGHEVRAVATAEAGADELARQTFDLLLTDYNLPGRNADWMLAEARAGGRLESTPVIVLTGASRPAGVDGYRVLQKPVDIGVLLSALEETLASSVSSEAGEASDDPTALHLSLYVTVSSRESQKAIRNLHRILRRFDSSQVHLKILDVARSDLGSVLEEDRIVVTPTLVRTAPLPKVWAFGDLSRPEGVEEMIGSVLDVSSVPPL